MGRYLLAAAALGALAFWGSEVFFWSAPPEGLSVAEVALTWAAYAVCAAAALSAVLATGIQGWRAAFLGGALLGWCVEGVVVPTMYQGFPFQVVWTPLAWHALVTGLLVVGLGRAVGAWPLGRRLGAWAALGLAGGAWAAYWPLERGAMPGLAATGAYLVGLGLLVPLAHLLLDRLGSLPVPGRTTLTVAPLLVLLAWLAQVAVAPSPVFLAWPAVVGLTWWVMRRLGEPGRPGLRLGATGGPASGAAFLLVPVVATCLGVALGRPPRVGSPCTSRSPW